MTNFRTTVIHLAPSPLGLLPESWAIEHVCRMCRLVVSSDQLIEHAKLHEADEQ